ncbi:MAG: IPT/TIG domain-containing protein, partial [Dehalococcoidia bacterium]
GDKRTDSDGKFNCTILIPESIGGEHTISVSDVTGSEASATFTVEAEVAISPTTRAAGDEVTVTGTGFGDEKGVTITLNGEGVVTSPSSIETDEYGNFAASFEVPDVAGATYDVEVEDEDGNKGEAEFTEFIATEVSISPITSQASPGYVGMDITISSAGFIANHEIVITYATEPIVVATTISDEDGAFSATFKVPQSEPGEHIITANDGTNTLAVTFIMESEAPPTPELLLPELLPQEASRAEAETYFYWEDVTDDSLPVTYTLQVATNEDFTSASIVLAKEGLTDSEYAIAEEEKLEPRKKETPYYWRVKATDSASNESEWSAPGSFYIGGFFWPSWIIHLWWGLGALGAGFLGFWLSKRTAYRY